MRTKYWVPFRIPVALKLPESIIFKLHGIFDVAGVPQPVGPVPRIPAAVPPLAAPTPVRFTGTYVRSRWVPTVLGKFCCAKATNAGSAKVIDPLVPCEERRGSTAK